MKRCPSPEQLEQFLEEQLAEAETLSVSRHVASCDACQAVLEELTGKDDDVASLSSLRLSAAPVAAAPAAGDEPRMAFLKRLKQTPWSSLSSVSGRPGTAAGAAAAPAAPRIPSVAGYEILDVLGRGGMGVVYRARQVGLNRMVALKMILAGPHASTRDLTRFRSEAEAVARFHHPNIVQVFDVGDSDGRPFFALEYVNGGSLAARLRGDPQPVLAAAALVEEIARAIDFAHRHGVVHRDLKPANVLIAEGDRDPVPEVEPTSTRQEPATQVRNRDVPKLADFGLAKRVGEPEGGTLTGEVLGTPSYMAPEQASGGGANVGPAADTYALGAILYEMITGRPPFKGATPFETVLQVLHEEPVRPGSLRPDLPRDLETICLKCLAKEPPRRYATAAALADDLRQFRQGRPIQARPVSVAERVWKWARRRPGSAALAAGIILVAILGYGGVTWQWQEAALARDAALGEKREKEEQRQKAETARNETEKARREVADQRERARTALYFNRIARSQLQWRVNEFTGAVAALDECRPSPTQTDRRGWEWYYLRGLYQSELFTLAHSGVGPSGGLAFLPDGKRIASVIGGYDHTEEDKSGEVRIWDARTGATLQRLPVSGPWHRLAVRPDGKQLALASTDGAVEILDVATGETVFQCQDHAEAVVSVAYHPSGRRFATASWDRTTKIWDADNGELEQTLRGHEGRVQCVAFHPDGGRIATASWDSTIKLWDARTGRALQTLRGHKGPVFSVCFSPDGHYLASAASNGNLKVWDLDTGRTIQSLTGHAGAVLDVTFSPDSRYLAYGGGDSTVRVWDVESGIEGVISRGHTTSVESVRFSPDGQRLISSSPGQGAVKVWDFTHHPEYGTFAHTRADVEALAFDAEGSRLLTFTAGGRLQAWDAATGVLKDECTLPAFESGSPGVLAAFDDGCHRLAAVSRDDARIVTVWDAETRLPIATLGRHVAPVNCVRFSKDGRLLATCSDEESDAGHELRIWEMPSGREVAAINGFGGVLNVVFSPDGRLVALAVKGGIVSILDFAARQEIHRVTAHAGDTVGLAFSPDGLLVATSGLEDRSVKIWELDGLARGPGPQKPRRRLASPPQVCDLAFSPDGRRLAGVSRDLVGVWDVVTGQQVLTLRGAPQRHWDPPFNPRIVFSADGTRLAASNWDESISTWDAGMPKEDAAVPAYQEARRQAADERALFWHLQEAEHCLDHQNRSAAQFHLKRLGNTPLPRPLQGLKERILKKLDES